MGPEVTTTHSTQNRGPWAGLLGGALGFGLAALLLVDPWGLHSIDEALRGESQHGHGATHNHGVDHGTAADAGAEDQLWTCGMHPQVIRDEPGQCPICHMDLTPLAMGDLVESSPMDTVSSVDGSMDHGSMDHGSHGSMDHGSMDHGSMDHGSHGSHGSMDHSATHWVCPMHPEVAQGEAGWCPKCAMALVEEPLSPEGMDATPPSGPTMADHGAAQGATVRVEPSVVQAMNVRTAAVERRDVHHPIRTVGYLEYDQDRMVTVTTKYAGWVEAVHVDYVGEPVRAGQPLFDIYSPELVQTQQELLSALAFAQRLEGTPEETQRRATGLVEAARTRLRYWDISEEQIDKLERSGEVYRTLTVKAPAEGVVMKRMPSLEGMAVNPGMEVYHIANLSTLWLVVELFEDQIAWVREGTQAQISFTYFPGETFRGTVRFIEPALSERTRTLRVKIAVSNPDERLRSGMYATVVFRPTAAAAAVAVPSEAVLRTGERTVAVLDLGGGRFAPREVVLGHEADGWVEIRAGLEVGETVVTSSQFLLDSESSVREALLAMLNDRGAGHGR